MKKYLMKNILLQFDCIIDNIYLQKYIDLIFSNRDTKRIKYKTQKHHFIPVAYYKDKYGIKNRKEAQDIANSDSNNFEVNLLYKDHVLAHYYLALCSKGKFRYQNENAIFHVLGNVNYIKDQNYLNEYLFIKSLDKYQELYEDMSITRSKNYTGRHCKPNTDLHKKQISDKNKGNIYVRKFVDNTWISKKARTIDEYNNYIANGWEKGNIPRSCCSKDVGSAISKAKKNKVCINNGSVNKYIDVLELDKYIENGWVKGPHKQFIKKRIKIFKLDKYMNIFEDELQKYLERGWQTCEVR